MNRPDLNDADLDTILDALDLMERKDTECLPSMEILMKIMPEPRDEERHQAYAEFRRDMKNKEKQLQIEKKIRREKITLLKAKIIMWQQDEAIEHIGDPDPEEKDSDRTKKKNSEHECQ